MIIIRKTANRSSMQAAYKAVAAQIAATSQYHSSDAFNEFNIIFRTLCNVVMQ